MPSPYYPDDISGADICYMEGCIGRGPCPRCGETNYALMGYYGAIARWAKVWGVSKDEAESRIIKHQNARGQAVTQIRKERLEEKMVIKVCPDCGEDMLIAQDSNGTGELFLQCSSFPKCEWAEEIPEHVRLERMGSPKLFAID